MNITNVLGLPDALVEAVRNDPYDSGDCDITVTQLVGPPQIRRLRKLHEAQLFEDASDRIWALLGQAVHTILERASSSNSIAEHRMYADANGVRISGQLDTMTYSPCTLSDYKVTSAWTAIRDVKPEWVAQLNCYAFLCRANNIAVDRLEVVALYRDWSRLQVLRSSDYPRMQVQKVEIPVWGIEETEQWVHDRIAKHFADEIIPCTDEERWIRPGAWAVMKTGRKTAVRVLPTQDEALEWAVAAGAHDMQTGEWFKGHYLEHRPDKFARCETYCPVSDFCEQWQNTRTYLTEAGEEE